MFGKGKCRTAPAPHGEKTPSIKPKKASELNMKEKQEAVVPLEDFIPDDPGRVHISDEVLDSIIDQMEARMLKRSKGKLNKVVKVPDKLCNLKLSIDTTELSRKLDEVTKSFHNLNSKRLNAKQPRLRIDMDDIADTPKVFVDGIEQQGLCHIDLSWNTDSAVDNRYSIDFVDGFGRLHRIDQAK
ncbi:hypothetical protein [Lactiplantibacillus plantarum]|uniref:hypothetical protein n=1 Tax=Lactiplantibacillus plantarum TaxID=1590 RepID=UPI0010821DA0|nr:hypothetical protein [Lactiplantibacillus plantarum]QBX93943.1 hypothetical protein DVH03_06095 [Lactiplantibacillus plantarum]